MEAAYKRIEGEVASVAPPVSRPLCRAHVTAPCPELRQFTHNSPTTHPLCMDVAKPPARKCRWREVRSNRADQVGAARLC